MGFLKSLIFEGESTDKSSKKVKEESISFPKSEGIAEKMPDDTKSVFDSTPTINSSVNTSTLSCEPHMDSVLSLYENGFDSLNQDGYDFYEYYKAVLEAGADNPEMYKMALTMAKAMDSGVTKETLLSQSDFYLTEIEKVHGHYVAQGNKKKVELETQKNNEESTLKSKLQAAEKALQDAQNAVNGLRIQIGSIDNKYGTELHEINCKLEANDTAKKGIVNSINKVKQGISKNL